MGLNRGPRGLPQRPEPGFTLLELLVVLTLIGVALAVSAPSLQRMIARPEATQSATDRLVNVLARQRDRAIRQQQWVRLQLSRRDATLTDSAGALLFSAPPALAISPIPESAEEAFPCVFRPDGGGCALRILITEGSEKQELAVDSMTGRIRLISRQAE